MNYNFFNTLIFSGIVYGFVFSINIINKYRFLKATKFLVATVLSLSLSNMQYWLNDIGLDIISNLYYIQFELLILPFYYLFLTRYLGRKNDFQELFLFAPFLVCMLYQVLTIKLPIDKALLAVTNLIIECATIGYNVVLIWMSLVKINRYIKRRNQEAVEIPVLWIKQIIWVGVILCIIWILLVQLSFVTDKAGLYIYYPLWIGISFLIYYLGSKSIIELRIFNDRNKIRAAQKLIQLNPSRIETMDLKNGKSYKTYNKILDKIYSDKLYLIPNLSLAFIAGKFQISPGYLSQIISQFSNKNFNDLINEMRVDESKKMLESTEFENYTVQAIGLESGFNSKSTFYTAFKKITGLTPIQFKNSIGN